MKTAKLLSICLLLLPAVLTRALAEDAKKPDWWGKAPGPRPVARGVVANVSPANIAVQTMNGLKPFVVDEKTRVVVRGENATIADVKVGDPVAVKFQLQGDNVPLALGILVPKPVVGGEIVSIQGNVIVIHERPKGDRPKATGAKPAGRRAGPRHDVGGAVSRTQPAPGVERRILVTESTRYRSHGYQGTLADPRIGYKIAAHGATNGGDFVADQIEFVPAMARGAVTAIDPNGIITVKTVRQLNVQLRPSEATVVLVRPRVGPNVKGTIADVKVGAPVNVGFHPNENGPSPLLWIDVLTGT